MTLIQQRLSSTNKSSGGVRGVTVLSNCDNLLRLCTESNLGSFGSCSINIFKKIIGVGLYVSLYDPQESFTIALFKHVYTSYYIHESLRTRIFIYILYWDISNSENCTRIALEDVAPKLREKIPPDSG